MARLQVGNRWAHDGANVDGLQWRHGADGGCLTASWRLDRSASNLRPPGFRTGAPVEIYEGRQRVWFGTLDQPGRADVDFTATGLLAQSRKFMAVDGSGDPTDSADLAIETAIGNGLLLDYAGDAPANEVPSEKPLRLDELIGTHATANGVRATVRGDRLLRWESDPTTPRYVILPGTVPAPRPADEEFATTVIVRYVSSVSGSPPVADGFTNAEATDADAEAIHGRREVFIDITDRGYLTATEAGWIADGILTKYGVRYSFADSVTVTGRDLLRGSSPVNLATVDAGHMVRFLGVRDPSSVGGSGDFDVIVGATDYTDGSGVITLSPLGLVPRTLADVIASVPTIHTALNPMPGAGAVAGS